LLKDLILASKRDEMWRTNYKGILKSATDCEQQRTIDPLSIDQLISERQ